MNLSHQRAASHSTSLKLYRRWPPLHWTSFKAQSDIDPSPSERLNSPATQRTISFWVAKLKTWANFGKCRCRKISLNSEPSISIVPFSYFFSKLNFSRLLISTWSKRSLRSFASSLWTFALIQGPTWDRENPLAPPWITYCHSADTRTVKGKRHQILITTPTTEADISNRVRDANQIMTQPHLQEAKIQNIPLLCEFH